MSPIRCTCSARGYVNGDDKRLDKKNNRNIPQLRCIPKLVSKSRTRISLVASVLNNSPAKSREERERDGDAWVADWYGEPVGRRSLFVFLCWFETPKWVILREMMLSIAIIELPSRHKYMCFSTGRTWYLVLLPYSLPPPSFSEFNNAQTIILLIQPTILLSFSSRLFQVT